MNSLAVARVHPVDCQTRFEASHIDAHETLIFPPQGDVPLPVLEAPETSEERWHVKAISRAKSVEIKSPTISINGSTFTFAGADTAHPPVSMLALRVFLNQMSRSGTFRSEDLTVQRFHPPPPFV